jgi:hypothetical protein
MIYLQPVTLWAIVRDNPDNHTTEIAEHQDGAVKVYAERWKANEALMNMKELGGPLGWRVREILLVPPPMTATAMRQGVREEIERTFPRAQRPGAPE